MTTLTEQWKNGELEDGWYYIKVSAIHRKQEFVSINFYEKGFEGLELYVCLEVLASVPTYSEHQAQAELIKELVGALELVKHKQNRNRNLSVVAEVLPIIDEALTKAKECMK